MRAIFLACSTLFACSFQGHGFPVPDTSIPPQDGPTGDTPDSVIDGGPTIVQTGLIEDLDADIGASAAAWANQVAGAGDDVATTIGTITVVPNAVNGHAALSFPGTARMAGDDATAFTSLLNGSGFTWFAVVKSGMQRQIGRADRNHIFSTFNNTGMLSGFSGGVDRADHPYTIVRPAATDTRVGALLPTANTWVIIAGRLAAGTGSQPATLFLNSATPIGSLAVAGISGTSTGGPIVIGADSISGIEYYTGEVARVLIYDRALTGAEVSMTGQVLAATYGITTTF